jgi:hypothetical protein
VGFSVVKFLLFQLDFVLGLAVRSGWTILADLCGGLIEREGVFFDPFFLRPDLEVWKPTEEAEYEIGKRREKRAKRQFVERGEAKEMESMRRMGRYEGREDVWLEGGEEEKRGRRDELARLLLLAFAASRWPPFIARARLTRRTREEPEGEGKWLRS